MRAIKVFENMRFNRNNDISGNLNIGLSRYTNGAKIYFYGTSETTNVHSNKKYWIHFPKINSSVELTFASHSTGDIKFVTEPKDATSMGTTWYNHENETSIVDQSIKDDLFSYIVNRIDTWIEEAEYSDFSKKLRM